MGTSALNFIFAALPAAAQWMLSVAIKINCMGFPAMEVKGHVHSYLFAFKTEGIWFMQDIS